MSGQAIAIMVGAGVVGVVKYHDQRTRAGGDWLFGAIITAGLLLTFVMAGLHG